MSKPEFDPNRPFAQHREWDKPIYICQDGHLFSQSHEYVGKDPHYKPPKEPEEVIEPPVDSGKEGVLKRAAAKLDGYTVPDEISDAKKENMKAQAAERLAG